MNSIRPCWLAVALASVLGVSCVQAQEAGISLDRSPDETMQARLDDSSLPPQGPQQTAKPSDGESSGQDTAAKKDNPAVTNSPDDQAGKQTKRILWIIPNYRAVSADTHLPPLKFKEKLWLATEDTFDYSDFIYVGALAGIAMSQKSEPSFGQGAAGFGRYYWRIFVDGGIENYMVEAVMPAITRQDPRYYTLGKGGFFKRTGYAVGRLFVTRTDAGKNRFNVSEIVGAGAAAGIGNAYYPGRSNPFVKTYQRWGTQVALDGLFNILKEFWPDINHSIFHGKY